MFDNSDPFATETISFEAKLNKYKDCILNCLQHSFRGVLATSKSQNGKPDSEGNSISLAFNSVLCAKGSFVELPYHRRQPWTNVTAVNF